MENMRYFREAAKKIPVVDEVDVLVAGGGTAGMVAGLASARTGAETLVLDQHGYLGGTLTSGLVNIFGPFDNGERIIVGGISWEIVERLAQMGGTKVGMIYWRPFDSERLKVLMDVMSQESGVHLLFHVRVCDAIVENSIIKGVVIESKAGRQVIMAKVVIDATGDGDVAATAGIPFELGRKRDGLTQPVSLLFRMYNANTKSIPTNPGRRESGSFSAFYKERSKNYAVAQEMGHLSTPHSSLSNINAMPIDGEIHINHTRIQQIDALDPKDLTKAELLARKQMMEIIEYLHKFVPECKDAQLQQVANEIGVRETRRILGEYKITVDDLLQYRKFKDRIGANTYPIDVHDPSNNTGWHQHYEKGKTTWIPYRALVPQKVDNLLVVGRCISSTSEAQSSVRGSPCCMITGEAAGTAAAISSRKESVPRKLNVTELQTALRAQGVILD